MAVDTSFAAILGLGFLLGMKHALDADHVGMVHGLAGSAALMLLVLATIKSVWDGIFYIVVFGVGSIGGMMLLTTAISVPLLWAARLEKAQRAITALVSVVSIGLGLAIMYEALQALRA